MQTGWLKYNPIKKRRAAGTGAVHWRCCLRESGRTRSKSLCSGMCFLELSAYQRDADPSVPAVLLLKSGAVPDESRSWI